MKNLASSDPKTKRLLLRLENIQLQRLTTMLTTGHETLDEIEDQLVSSRGE